MRQITQSASGAHQRLPGANFRVGSAQSSALCRSRLSRFFWELPRRLTIGRGGARKLEIIRFQKKPINSTKKQPNRKKDAPETQGKPEKQAKNVANGRRRFLQQDKVYTLLFFTPSRTTT